jgi:hypothetical protein
MSHSLALEFRVDESELFRGCFVLEDFKELVSHDSDLIAKRISA